MNVSIQGVGAAYFEQKGYLFQYTMQGLLRIFLGFQVGYAII